MKYWGVAIPGLCMNASELPEVPGLLRLNNPEVGDGVEMGRFYTLEEVAEVHANRILQLQSPNQFEEKFTMIGMSMGGMILSILATHFRSQLPRHTQFRFFVTSPNLKSIPVQPTSRLMHWIQAIPRTEKNLAPLVEPVFSRTYKRQNPNAVLQYAGYIARGENKQSLWKLIRQIHALRKFNGKQYFPRVDPQNSLFVGGKDDYLLGPAHNVALKELVPAATHIEVPNLGHMINMEAPHFFNSVLPSR